MLADIFVIRSFARAQKPPPAADVIDQDQVEISSSGVHIAEQF